MSTFSHNTDSTRKLLLKSLRGSRIPINNKYMSRFLTSVYTYLHVYFSTNRNHISLHGTNKYLKMSHIVCKMWPNDFGNKHTLRSAYTNFSKQQLVCSLFQKQTSSLQHCGQSPRHSETMSCNPLSAIWQTVQT